MENTQLHQWYDSNKQTNKNNVVDFFNKRAVFN